MKLFKPEYLFRIFGGWDESWKLLIPGIPIGLFLYVNKRMHLFNPMVVFPELIMCVRAPPNPWLLASVPLLIPPLVAACFPPAPRICIRAALAPIACMRAADPDTPLLSAVCRRQSTTL